MLTDLKIEQSSFQERDPQFFLKKTVTQITNKEKFGIVFFLIPNIDIM